MGLVIAVATIAGYGTLWWIVGTWAAGQGSPLGYAFALVVYAALLGSAWRRLPQDPPERRRERARRGKIIGIVTSALCVLIVIALNLLRDIGHSDLLMPVVAIVVGLHFLAFARLFPARLYYLTSALLVVVGIVGLFLGAGSGRVLLVSLAASCVLWLTCGAILIWPTSRRVG